MINNGIVKDNLILYLDSTNPKSYAGESTTNLISPINAYPSVGNQWGTYNVNQYNGGNFFTIGTVSGVSDDIVTMTDAHPLRTYDVVRPETTGGGLTANKDYHIKKISNTQFSVHQYTSIEDGSLGFLALETIQKNIKIPINATNFPTMWKGYPHLGNSGIIKTIIPNGFNFDGRKHDCLRHHAYRPDNVVDGMAYGVSPTVGANVTFTVSCMMRSVSHDSVYIYWRGYAGGTTPKQIDMFAGNVTRNWKRYTYTYTTLAGATTLIQYWLDQTPKSIIDISEIQVEVNKNHATPFTIGTRDGGIIYDLSGNGNNGIINGPTQNTIDKSLVFDGVDDYISLPNDIGYINKFSVFCWFKGNAEHKKNHIMCGGTECEISTPIAGSLGFGVLTSSGRFAGNRGSGLLDGSYHYIGFTYDGDLTTDTIKSYIDGIFVGSLNCTGTLIYNFDNRRIGNFGVYYANGNIPCYHFYNRVLSNNEIAKNYNATKGRFGL